MQILTALSTFNVRFTGVLIALCGALLMSFDPIFIRLSGVNGVDTAFLFGLFTAVSMPFFIQTMDKRGLVTTYLESGWPVVISGLLMLGSASCLVMSIKLTTVANTFVILSTTPALAALFSWLFLREVTQRSTWIAIAAVMVGIVIVVSGSFQAGNWTGDLLALAAASFLSLNQTLLRKYQGVSRMASVGLGGLFLAIAMFYFATPSEYSFSTWTIMAVMGLFTAPFGRVLSQTATRYITAPEVGMILMIEAVFAPVLAYLFFTEIPAMASFLGGAVILVTVFSYALFTAKATN
ncbi:DMT family transporter [Neptuniibacter caesariensis]|nr:EamA family transporter [Neptuniibacter caesariensis]